MDGCGSFHENPYRIDIADIFLEFGEVGAGEWGMSPMTNRDHHG
jgi:hypothetical protein